MKNYHIWVRLCLVIVCNFDVGIFSWWHLKLSWAYSYPFANIRKSLYYQRREFVTISAPMKVGDVAPITYCLLCCSPSPQLQMITLSSEFVHAYDIESNRLSNMVDILKLRVECDKFLIQKLLLDASVASFQPRLSSPTGFQAISFCKCPIVQSTLCVPIERISFEGVENLVELDKAVWMGKVRAIQSHLQSIVRLNVELVHLRAEMDAVSDFAQVAQPGENV